MCAAGLPPLPRLVARVREYTVGAVVSSCRYKEHADGTTGSEAGFRQIQELCSRQQAYTQTSGLGTLARRGVEIKDPDPFSGTADSRVMHTIVTSLITLLVL